MECRVESVKLTINRDSLAPRAGRDRAVHVTADGRVDSDGDI